jgi:predicted nucleic acid-binding protein
VILLDTNVLVYATNARSPRHLTCLRVVEGAMNRMLPGVLVPQVLLEYYAVVTRSSWPQPLEPEVAWAQVEALMAAMPVLIPPAETLSTVGALARHTRRRGPGIFDLFLLAQIRGLGIDAICTDNVRDFQGLGVRALTPEDMLELPPFPSGWTLNESRRTYGRGRMAARAGMVGPARLVGSRSRSPHSTG